MSARALADLLRTVKPPWVVLRSARKGPAADLGDLHGMLLRSVDGLRCRTKSGLLRDIATALEFPAYFGDNWDALEESLQDLEWAPARGYVLVFRDADHILETAPEERPTFIAILEAAGAEWARRSKPFHAVLILPRAVRAAVTAWGVPAYDG